MKQISFVLFICFSFGLLMTSCGNLDPQIISNRKKLPELRVGMTENEVLDIMGEPVKNQKYCRPDVWFYYTDCKWSDGMITRDETTPMVFKDGKLVGWGQDYYKNNCLFESWE